MQEGQAPPSPGASPLPQSQRNFDSNSLPWPERFGNPSAAQEKDLRMAPTEVEEPTGNHSEVRGESHVR
jgi:hypothetical protein